ncbi:MAG: hypothetical protein ACR2LN_04530 [Candidatus Levyibacteriota bacterium]
MAVIFETDNFSIESADKPYVSREEGGHIYLFPKVPVRDRTQLSAPLAVEYMKLSMVVGDALPEAMQRRGVDIGIINYQDMGNWRVFTPEGPTLHMHIYGRAKTAGIQKYGEAVQLPQRSTGFYDNFKPLDEEDRKEIKKVIKKLIQTTKYQHFV